MEIEYSAQFRKQYLKANVRVRNKTDVCIQLFEQNPSDLQLNNHELKRGWKGHRSIDITADWRAIYQEEETGGKIVFTFVALGIHDQLYKLPRENLKN